jgi:hypothetical protein
MEAIPSEMTASEISCALWMIDVFERSSMSAKEADEWRRRIRARQRFLGLTADDTPAD